MGTMLDLDEASGALPRAGSLVVDVVSPGVSNDEVVQSLDVD